MSAEALDVVARALKAVGWAFTPALLLPLLFVCLPRFLGLKPICETLIEAIDAFHYRLAEIIKWGLVALVISIAFSVIALSVFGLSWTKLSESAEYFHASAILLGSAATLLASQHVRVDIFYTHMRPETKALVDFIGFYALLLPVCLIILWNSQSFLYYSWVIWEGSAETDGIRGTFLLKTLISFFAVSMIVQAFAIALRAALCLRGFERPQRPEPMPNLYPAPSQASHLDIVPDQSLTR